MCEKLRRQWWVFMIKIHSWLMCMLTVEFSLLEKVLVPWIWIFRGYSPVFFWDPCDAFTCGATEWICWNLCWWLYILCSINVFLKILFPLGGIHRNWVVDFGHLIVFCLSTSSRFLSLFLGWRKSLGTYLSLTTYAWLKGNRLTISNIL